ncbi:lysophospholipid acyltransferase LPEAT1-like isoform X2 [Neltuma alba]|uniref:lysophospholipid acyltransferase LPEAT1-like isoform X2 n=1 Tax=Neltuma alba TaxID=207710 RepID=UPI0010A4B910|nr:lysophospholipid acyltransferase LPEAT1-like isoform X2 [Prosopis alba]XP_028791625.1 lysophospholipid acyltransferase LPEAT1-like isoform X2 [Prosopis alba]
METELKDLNSNPPELDSSADPDPVHDEASAKDDRPLLKPDPTSHVSSGHLEDLEKKFAAFVRYDAYGIMGRGELPTREKLLLGLALVTLVPIRVAMCFALLFTYYLICRICTLFYPPNREEEQEHYANMAGLRRALIIQSGRSISRLILFVLGFYWISETYRFPNTDDKPATEAGKDQPKEMEAPGVIISNHVSYLDILYHMSSSFPSFVAKRSVARLPLIGLISKCLGCVYVQRESKSSDFKGVSGVVTERIQEAHRNKSAPIMMLFPEGTTTNGDFLLPFKTGSFLASVPVLPVILRYPYQRFSPAWDSISGVRHVILLLCQFVNYMEVTRLPVYYPSQQEKDDPKLYANNVRRLMAGEGNLILSDIGLAEKRIYHSSLNGL